MTIFHIKTWFLTFFILVGTSSISFSQNSFDVTIKDSIFNTWIHHAVELANGQLILVGVRPLQTGDAEAIIYKIDPYGKILQTKTFRYNEASCGLTDIVQLSNNRLIVSGITYTGTIGNLWACIIDSSLNIIDQKSYMTGPYSLAYSKMKLDYQNNILIYGKLLDSTAMPHSLIFKLTSELDSISGKIYNGGSTGQDLIERSDHKGYYYLIIGMGDGSGKILTLDSDFNIQSINELADGIGNLGTIRLLNPTQYLVCAVKNPTSETNVHKIGVQLYDTGFQLIHYNIYGKTDTTEVPASVKSIDFTDTSSLFIGGTSNISSSFYPFSTINDWYRLNCIDTSFNLKWEKFYGGDGYYNLFGILATHDGGCLMYGLFWDWHNISDHLNYIRLIKVSKDGLLSDKNGEPSDKVKEVILYPNPGYDRILIESALKNLSMSLYDLMGNRVLSQSIESSTKAIDVSGLLPGIYFYQISSGVKVVDSGKWIKAIR